MQTVLRALAVVAALAAGASSVAAQSVMKLASATINDVQHEWQKVFAAKMAEAVGDQLTVEIYPASQLGAIPRMSEGVLLGTIEAFTTPTAFMTNVDARFQVFDVPGVFSGPEALRAALHEPAYREHFETMYLDKGLRVIGVIYNSPILALTKTPAPTIADLEGLKIRTFASPLQMEPMKALGAIPTPLPLSEVVPQLQSGGIDGLLAGMPILTAFKFYDTAKYVTELNFVELVSITVMNEAWFQSQPEAVRDAIIKAGREAEQEVFSWGVANVERANQAWVDNGGEILSLSDADRAAMVARFAEASEVVINQNPLVAAEFLRLKAQIEATGE